MLQVDIDHPFEFNQSVWSEANHAPDIDYNSSILLLMLDKFVPEVISTMVYRNHDILEKIDPVHHERILILCISNSNGHALNVMRTFYDKMYLHDVLLDLAEMISNCEKFEAQIIFKINRELHLYNHPYTVALFDPAKLDQMKIKIHENRLKEVKSWFTNDDESWELRGGPLSDYFNSILPDWMTGGKGAIILFDDFAYDSFTKNVIKITPALIEVMSRRSIPILIPYQHQKWFYDMELIPNTSIWSDFEVTPIEN